jgi:hypothetical protein
VSPRRSRIRSATVAIGTTWYSEYHFGFRVQGSGFRVQGSRF